MQHLENARDLRSSSIFVIYPWRPWWLASRELRAISRICPSQSPVCRNIVEPLTFLLWQADQAQNWKFAWHFSSALDRAINPLFFKLVTRMQHRRSDNVVQPPARNLFIVSRQANMNAFSDTEGDEVSRVIQTDRPRTCLLLIFQDPMFFRLSRSSVIFCYVHCVHRVRSSSW